VANRVGGRITGTQGVGKTSAYWYDRVVPEVIRTDHLGTGVDDGPAVVLVATAKF